MLCTSDPDIGICSVCKKKEGGVWFCCGGHYICNDCRPKHRKQVLKELEEFYRSYHSCENGPVYHRNGREFGGVTR